MYKYYTWTDACGYFKGQDLLRRRQIQSLLRHLDMKSEAFATIQDYDHDGNIIGCPVYFDIDSPSLYDAYNDMHDLIWKDLTGADKPPAIWFSGGKGFHVVSPVYIRHPRCHEIMKLIADDMTVDVDMSVYRTRSMWRCNNTYNKKSGMYKVRVDPTMGLDYILKMAKEPSHVEVMPPYNRFDMPDGMVQEYAKRLPVFSSGNHQIDSDFVQDMKPCMRKLWEMDGPPAGQAHKLLHIMSRHCYRSGLSESEAIAQFSGHHFWKGVRPRDYEKVIASVYRNGTSLIGCRNGSDGDLLRQYCSTVCCYNEDFIDKLFNGGEQ